MKPGKVRPLALAIIRQGDRILVSEGYDPIKQQAFYRPLGGKIEFGERGAEAAIRELREELNAELTNVRYLGMLENIFTFVGQAGHEIVLLYEARFADPMLYAQESIEGVEPDDGSPIRGDWKSLSAFGPDAPLYPDGLLALIEAQSDSPS